MDKTKYVLDELNLHKGNLNTVSQETGISRRTLGYFMRGETELRTSNLEKLHDYFSRDAANKIANFHYVYRHYSYSNELLYVGRTFNVLARHTSGHCRVSDWYHEVKTIVIQKYKNKQEATMAEKIAIKKENPKYNIQGKS